MGKDRLTAGGSRLVDHARSDGSLRSRRRRDRPALAPATSGTATGLRPAGIGQAATSTASASSTPATSATSASTTSSPCAAWIRPHGPAGRHDPLAHDRHRPRRTATASSLQNGKVQVNLVKRWLDDALRVETERACRRATGITSLVTYDGSRVAPASRSTSTAGRRRLKVILDELNQTFDTQRAAAHRRRRRSGGSLPRRYRRRARLRRRASADEAAWLLATPNASATSLALPAEKRTPAQASKLRACFLERHAPAGDPPGLRERAAILRAGEARLDRELPDHDGHGGDAGAARHLRPDPRRVRQARREGRARRARVSLPPLPTGAARTIASASPAGWSIRRTR